MNPGCPLTRANRTAGERKGEWVLQCTNEAHYSHLRKQRLIRANSCNWCFSLARCSLVIRFNLQKIEHLLLPNRSAGSLRALPV